VKDFVQDQEWKNRYWDYQSFVKNNHDKRILVLELGVGAGNRMIKAPFMELVNAEQNAFYITFNKGELYIPDMTDSYCCKRKVWISFYKQNETNRIVGKKISSVCNRCNETGHCLFWQENLTKTWLRYLYY
jgi:hypothetical protein